MAKHLSATKPYTHELIDFLHIVLNLSLLVELNAKIVSIVDSSLKESKRLSLLNVGKVTTNPSGSASNFILVINLPLKQ